MIENLEKSCIYIIILIIIGILSILLVKVKQMVLDEPYFCGFYVKVIDDKYKIIADMRNKEDDIFYVTYDKDKALEILEILWKTYGPLINTEYCKVFNYKNITKFSKNKKNNMCEEYKKIY